jgi:hypothetical protein
VDLVPVLALEQPSLTSLLVRLELLAKETEAVLAKSK